MTPQGKSLQIDAALLDDLVEILYRDKRLFPVLALLYPGVDTRNEFHVDHVFPKSLFTPAKLEAAGVPAGLADDFRARFDRMPNLQLLEGPENEAKRNRLPADWVKGQYPDATARGGWLASHDLHDLPADLDDFLDFYEARRFRMRARLAEALGVVPIDAGVVVADVSNEPANALVPASVRRVVGTGGPSTKAYFTESLQDLVAAGDLAVGSVLSGRHRGETFTVRIAGDGRPQSGGQTFDSLSQAARELTGQSAVNGWKFWKLPDGRSVGELRSK